MNILVVVDMQNDFIDGSLGTEEAQRIVPEVVKKIQTFDGIVFATRDTHEENYLETIFRLNRWIYGSASISTFAFSRY